MAGERGDFDRWWHSRQAAGGSPLRGSSPSRPMNYPARNESPGLRRHSPRDWSPFNAMGHSGGPSTGSPTTNTSHHRDPYLSYQQQGQQGRGGVGHHHGGGYPMHGHQSPRQPSSPSPMRSPRDPSPSAGPPSPLQRSYDHHNIHQNHHQQQQHLNNSTADQQYNNSPWRRDSPSSPSTNSPRNWNTNHHAYQQQQSPQHHHNTSQHLNNHHHGHHSPHHNSTQQPLRDISQPSNNNSRHNNYSQQPQQQQHESPITQVPQGQQQGGLPVMWPPEFLPPEPDPRTFTPLLPPKDRAFKSKNTLVLDLDETLVHSSFKPITLVDMLIDIELPEGPQTVYVRKRPYVEDFLARVSEIYEVVVLTASLEVYADRVLDQLDPDGFWIHHRLFRDSCANLNGNYIKDLSYLGRPLHEVIIIDNSPTSYMFQPRNAVPISSWYDDPTDTELRELLPVLERAAKVDNVYPVLDSYRQAIASGDRWYP